MTVSLRRVPALAIAPGRIWQPRNIVAQRNRTALGRRTVTGSKPAAQRSAKRIQR